METTMHRSSARSTQLPAIILCILGLGLAGLTGCDRSEGDSKASAEANAPSETEQAESEDKAASADEESADEETDETAQKPGSATKKPAPTGSDKTDDKTGDDSEGGDKITDAELKKFIEISNTLRPKQAEMKKALKNAESKAEAREAQKMVMEETRKAVEESGLSFERFKTISQRAKGNKKLQMRLQRLAMEQKQGEK
jgi:hypothetical protein